MLKAALIQGKGRALRATGGVQEGAALLVEEPLLCASRAGAVHACGTCLGDAAGVCEACGEGICGTCAHTCTLPDSEECSLRDSIWYRLYCKYVHRLMQPDCPEPWEWAVFARLAPSVYEGWASFSASADVFVRPLRRRLGPSVADDSMADRALTVEGFLDFFLLIRANAVAIGDRGSALFRGHACLNHACEPNALALRFPDFSGSYGGFHPASIIVLACRHIEAGEEVCINYLHDENVSDMRRELRERYGFDCGCVSCQLRLCKNLDTVGVDG